MTAFRITRFAIFGETDLFRVITTVKAKDASTALSEWGNNFTCSGKQPYVEAIPDDDPEGDDWGDQFADFVGYYAEAV